MTPKRRLVTRSDMDGLVSAVLLREAGFVNDITFVHPKDMQDGLVEVTSDDILTNLPYAPGAHLVFDHHFSEKLRNPITPDNHIIDPNAPSASRVVYDFLGGEDRFPARWDDMMAAVDKADAAMFSLDDVLEPRGWELLSFLMDARTGLGRFHDFRISNYQLMMQLIDYCSEHGIDEILELPDVEERTQLYFGYEDRFKDQIRRCTEINQNLIVLDLRREETIWPGNRFMVYALSPEQNISMHVIWGKQRQNVAFPVGKSIFNRSSRTNVGELMLAYGGGGHVNAGTCQVDIADAEVTKLELIGKILADG
jgi:nanoRNase/pAp phosphatase (c-di-AMP/oligoRNAs hydrolase)